MASYPGKYGNATTEHLDRSPHIEAWTDEELAEIAGANELTVAPLGDDGTVQSPRIVWVVRRGDDVYIRSVNGDEGAWFRGVQAHHAGHISAGGSSAVEHITRPKAQATTLRIVRS